MLPIYAFVADLDCPPDVSAADHFTEVGGAFISWVEAGFAEDVPGFGLPGGGTAEPLPGHVVEVESEQPDAAHELFRIVWRQPWLLDGSACQHEYAVARAGDRLSASVAWHLTASAPLPPDAVGPDRPAVIDQLRPYLGADTPDDRHPLDGLARADRGGAFRAVRAVLEQTRLAEQQERTAYCVELDKEVSALVAERKELLLEVDHLNETVYEQKVQIRALSRRKRHGNEEAELFEPASLVEVLTRIQGEFPHELTFLKSAEDSAGDSDYQSPGRVYDLLHALGDIARRWRTGTLGMDWYEAFQKADAQFVYKPHISTTTATNNWEDYAFQYDGAKRLFEAHVSLGKSHSPQKCLSVHWYRDEDQKRVIVGWCGRHLPNTKS